ncbi:MAG: ribbon-helix-helix domain-containing protein [Patescibacteria group bacterium]
MLKVVAIALPEKMIQEVDEMLFEKNFVSRSDFFRHLVRMWFHNSEHVDSKNIADEESKEFAAADEEVDLEFGIPPKVMEEIKEKAKLLN